MGGSNPDLVDGVAAELYMHTARASAIWEHRSDLAWVRCRARMEPADHRDPDQVCRLRDDTDLWSDRGRFER